MNKKKIILLLTMIITASIACLYAITEGEEKSKIIKLIKADTWSGLPDKEGEKKDYITGNVEFEHDGSRMYCDTAIINIKENSIDVHGNVHLWLNDTISLYGDDMIYSGNTKIADIRNNVRLIDGDKTLYTEHLIYNRNTNQAFYPNRGKIVDKDNTLTSIKGYYFTGNKEFFFKDNVIVTNPDFVMNSDTLFYNTGTKSIKILGPTGFKSKDGDTAYSERGWYDTNTDIAQLKQNVYLFTGTQSMTADSIYFEKQRKFAQGFKDAVIKDTSRNVLLYSQFVEYAKSDGYGIAYDSLLFVNIDKKSNDSLFLHCDTLKWSFDEDNKTKIAHAYHKVKFFRKEFQGVCDSMTFRGIDSTLVLNYNPVLWNDKNQITADTIKVFFSKDKVDSTYLINTAFVVSQYAADDFNQIKGRLIKGYFDQNELKKIMVLGNAETLYYIDDEDSTLVGINRTYASRLRVMLNGSQISKLVFYDKPDGGIYPDNQFPVEEKKLKQFKWRDYRRPYSKQDVFIWINE